MSECTPLRDRILWYDGDSSYPVERLLELMRSRDVFYVDNITDEIRQYNMSVPSSEEIKTKTSVRPLDTSWNIPEEYLNLDIAKYLTERHKQILSQCDPSEHTGRRRRLADEFELFLERDLTVVLQAIIWIINSLITNNVVWGVGRGSSVSSYLLFVIGVHDVDSYHYDLDIEDFLHDQ